MTHQSNEFDLNGFETVENLTKGHRFYFEDLLLTYFNLIKIESVKVRREGNNFDAIIDISCIEKGQDEQKSIAQTVAYFRRKGLRLPEFNAEPGRLGGDLMNFCGGEEMNVELAGYEDFNTQFSILTIEPDSTRTLFTREVIEAFQRNGEFNVKTGIGQIAIYRKGHTVPQAEQQRFYTSAREIVDAITRSAAALPAVARPRGERWVETIQSMDGLIGRQLRKHLITKEHVNDFLAQSRPRKARGPIRNFAYDSNRFGMVWGAGWTLAVMAFFFYEWFEEDNISPILFLVSLIGVAVFFFCGRQWLRRRRLLRNGVCEQAQVVKVEALEMFGDDEMSCDDEVSKDDFKHDQYLYSAGRKHNVTFETGYGRFTIRIGRQPANLARLHQKQGKPTRVLIDTLDPSRVLWIDGLAVDTYL